jgi:pimeloyl-ACP methyl ester carboxylesterase
MINQHSSTQNSPERFHLEAGAGAPVVLLHCSAGSSRSFLPLMEALSAEFHVYAPDLLGSWREWGVAARCPPGTGHGGGGVRTLLRLGR